MVAGCRGKREALGGACGPSRRGELRERVGLMLAAALCGLVFTTGPLGEGMLLRVGGGPRFGGVTDDSLFQTPALHVCAPII